MTKKYPCPHHQEKTPSAVAYANSYFSFCCGRSGPLSELGLSPSDRVEITYVEDIGASIARIKALPKQDIRGFQLHADDRGYYLVWPDLTYYKRRVYGADASSKYRGPSGHTKPSFKVSEGSGFNLVLVEGEFNALSLGTLEGAFDVISPGGAGDFYSRSGNANLAIYARRYQRIDIVVDADASGAQAAIEAKAKLVTLGCPDVRIHLVEKDFNQILCDSGKEALRAKCTEMGLL